MAKPFSLGMQHHGWKLGSLAPDLLMCLRYTALSPSFPHHRYWFSIQSCIKLMLRSYLSVRLQGP